MKREIISGLVIRVEDCFEQINFVTLVPISPERWREITTPIYMKLGQEYEGKVVDIITETNNFWEKNFFRQTIKGEEFSKSEEILSSCARTYREYTKSSIKQNTK